MKIKIIILSLLSILLLSFTMNSSVVGVYFKGKDTHYFDLKADNTFEYKYVVDTFVDVISEGEWYIDKNKKVRISSYLEPEYMETTFERVSTPGSRTARQIQIHLDYDGDKDDLIIVPHTNRDVFPRYHQVRGEQTIETAFYVDKIAFQIFKRPIENTRPMPERAYQRKSLPPRYTGLFTKPISVRLDQGESAKITIKIDENGFVYRRFRNTILDIRGTKLFFRDSDDEKTHELEKQK